MNFYLLNRNTTGSTEPTIQKLLIRGDSCGRVAIWMIPEVSNKDLSFVRQESMDKLPEMGPTVVHSLAKAWESMSPGPCGILENLVINLLLKVKNYRFFFFLVLDSYSR